MIAELLRLAGWLAATLSIVGTPLSLLLMCLVLRLLGVSNDQVRPRALKFTDEWIKQRGQRGLPRRRENLR